MKRSNCTKAFAGVLALSMTVLSGCGGGTTNPTTAAPSAETTSATATTAADSSGETTTGSQTNSDKPFDGVTVTYAVSDTQAAGGEAVELAAFVKKKTGINIEFTILPTPGAGEVDRRLVMLQAGDELGILYNTTPGLIPFQNAGVLTPLEDLATADGYDMNAIYGDNLPIIGDGKVYGLPAFNDMWLTIYNKKIFDDAGVPYPSPENFTWEKYVETAKLLTNEGNDVWGSFMLDYDCYNYLYAAQLGAEHYKADGTANYDDPLFAQGMEFFYSLGNNERIQPDSVTYAAGVYPWNAFVSMGNMGMWPIGGWATSMLANQETYPRDWKAGILPMPYPEGSDPSTLVVTGCYAIPSTAANKEASFEAIKCMAEYQYTLGYGRIPARVDLPEEEIDRYITEDLIPTFEFDALTVEDIKACWFDYDRKPIPEKVMGTASTVINQIWIEEGQLYGQGGKDLQTAMAAIQERSNRAISEELASNQ